MAKLVLTEAMNGTHVDAAVGDVIDVRLPENPTTGHRWQVGSAGALRPEGDDFAPASAAAGAGGERTLRFSAQQPGATRIEISLRRPWESGSEPAARFSVTVQVFP